MTIMKKMIKPAVLALAISMTLSSGFATAGVRNTTGTLSIHGFQPLLPLVGAKGELKPGATVTISDEFYRYYDRDNGTSDTEKDISKDATKAIIQWYIRDEADADAALPPAAQAWGTGLTFTIPYTKDGADIDYANERKILSFRIVPLTDNGLPDVGKAVEVKNSIILGGSVLPPDTILPPGELPENPDNPYNPGQETEPGLPTPEITGPGGNKDPENPNPVDPPDESGVIYPAGDGFLVRIAYAKVDPDTGSVILDGEGNPVPDLARIVYDELADETKTKVIDQIDAYGNPLLDIDGITPLPQKTVSLKTPNIPMVKATYAVGIYEAKRDAAGQFIRDGNGYIQVKSDASNEPINMAKAFQKSIKWTLGASAESGAPTLTATVPTASLADFDGKLGFDTQANNDVAKAVSSVASEQGLVIGVTFNDNLASPANKGTAPAAPVTTTEPVTQPAQQ